MPSSLRAPRSFCFAKLFRLIAAGALAGCFLPIGAAAPQSARTVGSGAFGSTFSAELPTLDLIAEETGADPSDPNAARELPIAPAASMSVGLAYGLTDFIDLEVGVEGALYIFVIPIPLGVSGGLRVNLVRSESFDLGVAARVGHIGVTNESTVNGESQGSDHADATYASGSAVLQFGGTGTLRPGVALHVMPASIDVALDGEMPKSFNGMAASATFSLEIATGQFSFSPFVSLNYFDSDEFDASRYASVGVALQYRSRSRNPPAPVYAPPPPPASYPPPPASYPPPP